MKAHVVLLDFTLIRNHARITNAWLRGDFFTRLKLAAFFLACALILTLPPDLYAVVDGDAGSLTELNEEINAQTTTINFTSDFTYNAGVVTINATSSPTTFTADGDYVKLVNYSKGAYGLYADSNSPGITISISDFNFDFLYSVGTDIYSVNAANNILFTKNFTGLIYAANSTDNAECVHSQAGNITFEKDPLTGKGYNGLIYSKATTGSHQSPSAWGIRAVDGSVYLHGDSVSANDVYGRADIHVDAASNAYGIYAFNSLELGEAGGDVETYNLWIKSQGDSSAYAILTGAGGFTSYASIESDAKFEAVSDASNAHAILTNGSVAFAQYVAGDFLATSENNLAYGFRLNVSGQTFTASGGFTEDSSISAKATNGSSAYGISTTNGDITIAHGFAGNITASVNKSSGTDAYGISSGTQSGSKGDISIDDGLRGTIEVEGYNKIYGLYGGGIFGASEVDALVLTGTIDVEGASGQVDVCGIYSSSDGLLNVQINSGGKIESTAYALYSEGSTADRVLVKSGGTIDGDVSLFGGADRFEVESGVAITGTIDLGDGVDVLVLPTGSAYTANFELGAGTETLTLNNVTINGTLDMGNGDDALTLTSNSVVTSAIDMGDGQDTLELNGASATDGLKVNNLETLNKNGAGDWKLAQKITLVDSGAGAFVNVNSGVLYVNNTLTIPTTNNGMLNVANAATLGGSGVIGGNVTNSGTVSPGNSIGTLTIKGDYVSHSASSLQIELDAEGNCDKLIVTGTATLDGTLNITNAPGAYRSGTTFTFLEADTVIGEFSHVTVNALDTLSLTFEIHYKPDQSVDIAVVRVPFESLIRGYNQRPELVAVAANLDLVADNATGDMANIIGLLDGMSVEQMEQAFSQMLPNNTQAVRLASMDAGALFLSSTRDHALAVRNAMRGATPGANVAELSPSPMLTRGRTQEISGVNAGDSNIGDRPNTNKALQKTTDISLYARYIGNFGQRKRDDWGNKYSWQTNGVDMGLDFMLSENVLLGANAGFSSSTIALDNIASTNSFLRSYRVGIYSAYFDSIGPNGTWGDWYADASLGYALNENKLRRNITFTGVQRTAKADFISNALLAHVGAGYEYHWHGLIAGPVGSLEYVGLWQPAYSESGANALNLNVDANNSHSLQSGLGLRLAYAIKNTTQPGHFTPELRAEWRHEFMNNDQNITAALAGNPYGRFTVSAPALDKNSARLGTGFTASLGRYVEARALYQADISQQTIAHGLNATLQIHF